MSKEPETTVRPWQRRYNVLETNKVLIAEFYEDEDAALAQAAVNAWDDVLALEARIGELMRGRDYTGATDPDSFGMTAPTPTPTQLPRTQSPRRTSNGREPL